MHAVASACTSACVSSHDKLLKKKNNHVLRTYFAAYGQPDLIYGAHVLSNTRFPTYYPILSHEIINGYELFVCGCVCVRVFICIYISIYIYIDVMDTIT